MTRWVSGGSGGGGVFGVGTDKEEGPMGLVVLWLVCAAAAAAVANRKNRDALGWFVLGIVGGPLGLVVGLMPKLNHRQKG